ncbi:hypothetical protein [Solicola gregarius]|uniref:Secreted protein n=1 Tax=Solicola gregarius TaxID=2908642 RepID=A0AA46TIR0_9ACTN|nr:hypothetical protein [Solicola gregarius]UYM05883.1 hypothetical protein L0C25_02065 [Solicola gregarius]
MHVRTALAFRLLAATAVGAVSLAGCQYNTEVGAVNRCGEAVEVDVVSSKASADDGPAGDVLDPGERGYVRSVPESKDTVYVMVRRPDATRTVTRTVAVADLADPPEDADYEVEVALSGSFCPR